MALSFAKVLDAGFDFVIPASNCAFHTMQVCCMTNARYRAMRWQGRRPSPAVANDESRITIYESDDQGATWASLFQDDLDTTLTGLSVHSPATNRLLVGMIDPTTAAQSAFSVIAVSEDEGATWASAVSGATYGAFVGAGTTCRGFTTLPSGDVLAFGAFDTGGAEPIHFLKSTNGGQTFTVFVSIPGEASVTDCIAISALDLVCVVNGVRPYWSTDGGATWTEGTRGSVSHVIGRLTWMGGDLVISCGRNSSTALAAGFRSTDRGHTWSAPVNLPGGGNTQGTGIRSGTTQLAAAGGSDATVNRAPVNWLTEDAGASWAAGTFVDAVTNESRINPMTVTSQGFVLWGIDAPSSPTVVSGAHGQIWRGTIDDFAGPGTCEAEDGEPPVEPPPEPPEPSAPDEVPAFECVVQILCPEQEEP